VTRGALHAATLLAACIFSANGVRAAPGDATRLEYARSDRAAVCPDRTALNSAVSKRLGYDPFFPAARQAIIVEIIDVDAELRAQMLLIDEHGLIVGSRELREKVEQCDELVASLALAISIALDPSAALGEKRTTTDRTPRAERVVGAQASAIDPTPESKLESAAQVHPQKPGRAPALPSEPSEASRERPQFAARAALFANVGSAPALGFGWRLGLDVRRGWFRLAAEFSQQMPATKSIPEDGSAKASLLAGALAPCLATEALAGCGLVSLGALNTRGEGIPNASSQSSFYAALGARLEYTPSLFEKLQLLTQLDAVKPLTPVSLRVRGEEVWRTPLFAFAAGVGMRWRFQ
jgi:hypothetical protein